MIHIVAGRTASNVLIAISLMIVTVGPAGAEDWHEQEVTKAPGIHKQMVELSDVEMADAHGGFDWAGMNISFGADVQTYLNGQLALQTIVNWTANGITKETIVGSQLSLATASSGGAWGITVPTSLAANSVYFANDGRTALIQNTNGALQNVLINTMSNLNAVQQTNATVTLGNYSAFAAALRAGAMNMSVGHEIATFSH